ncbi:MAG TPA: right-handed parallel beta-helix repeat-containing protein [Burkholderiales bacterium]|nr:right-handed parallel beta-helix repeat-containing protein [Burkholderiales bacterium]
MGVAPKTICVYAAALLASCSLTAPHADDTLRAAPEAPGHRVLRVGPREELRAPSAAARIARDGDTVEIEAGVYPADSAVWRAHHLTIRGVGGLAHVRADGAQAEGKGLWIIKGNDTTLIGIELSGVKVPDNNGAGIRLEGRGLTVRNCYVHDNENGILTSPNPESDIVIESSEFAHNGAGDGLTHNLYIGKIRSFTLRYSYVHHAVSGHDVKSRAMKNTIAYNRIMDERDGKSSYSVEFPNGGLAFVIGNLIEQGPEGENFTIVSYGTEGLQHPQNELYFASNTVVNDRPGQGRFIFVKAADVALITNNLFSGPGDVLTGPGELRNNVTGRRSDFVDPSHYDYRLKARSAAVGRGVDPGSARGVALRPSEEYVHKAQHRPRSASGKLDAGALEYRPGDRP